MEQWTVIRQAIAQNRDIAELMTTGLRGESDLDAADQLRLEQMLQEHAWAAFHIWDRTQRGIFPKGTFEATAGAQPGGAPPNISASFLDSSRTSMPFLSLGQRDSGCVLWLELPTTSSGSAVRRSNPAKL
jgi:hypothetical protein